jgi:nuclear pore complex protein Nup85
MEPMADAQPDYWAVVRRLVALGRVSTALELLDCHDARRTVTGAGLRGASGSAAALQQPGIRAQVRLRPRGTVPLSARAARRSD